MVEVGKKAPAFSLYSDSGKKVALKDFLGKKVVLYFYPRDNTPGCTQEACDFRDEIDAFKSEKCVVLGVSSDSVDSHLEFKTKYDLPFCLLSDPEGKVCEKYGVIKEKNMYGKKRLGIDRSTFIIDEKGKVARAYRGVKVKGHIRILLDTLSA